MSWLILTKNSKRKLNTENQMMKVISNEYTYFDAMNGPFMGWIVVNRHELSCGIFFLCVAVCSMIFTITTEETSAVSLQFKVDICDDDT